MSNTPSTPDATAAFWTPPRCCPQCGVIDTPLIGPGKGPHHSCALCRHCGAFFQWLSVHTPEERQARRQAARAEAMARKPASEMQLAYLAALGHKGPAPATMLEASQRINERLRKG